jgi:2-keto-4-pentenoate hydratase/2-oxohepta-3-ene-1,7-dioic acid hydratase in catechol pathway
MSTTILRSAAGWWAVTRQGGVAPIRTDAVTTAELLGDRAAVDAAAAGAPTATIDALDLLAPVTAPCRVVAQMTNYVSHVKDSGMNPATVPLTFFRKASGSITGPQGEVQRPAHVRLLDYEVEIGLVIGRALPVGTEVDVADAARPKTQFYEAKSYPTFTPVGPRLVLLDDGEFERFADLRLTLRVNGETRQDSTVADMIYSPAQALRTLAGFQQLDPGDLVLTGTPGGTALKAPPKPVELVGALLPPALKWKIFFRGQGRNPRYLQPGDVVEAEVRTPDGALDLGTQRVVVRDAGARS